MKARHWRAFFCAGSFRRCTKAGERSDVPE